MNTPLDVCEKRDVKGLYKKAREGAIKGFTGIDQAYEEPKNADLKVSTENVSILESTYRVIEFLEQQNVIPRNLREIEVVSKCFSLSFRFCFRFNKYLVMHLFLFRFRNCLFYQVKWRQP